jgi:hypothetical protein
MIDEATFQACMLFWGYAVSGTDDIAYICERPGERCTPLGRPYWDGTSADLASQFISDGGPYRRVPDHYALPGVTDLRMRAMP